MRAQSIMVPLVRASATASWIVGKIVRDRRRHRYAYPLGRSASGRFSYLTLRDVGEESVTITTPLKLKRRGVEAKLIVGAPRDTSAVPNAKLVALLAQAQRWLDLLVSGEAETVDQIAAREKRDASDVGRALQLAFLAPDMVGAILTGRQPVDLTAQRLKRLGVLPLDWDGQRRLLGFPA